MEFRVERGSADARAMAREMRSRRGGVVVLKERFGLTHLEGIRNHQRGQHDKNADPSENQRRKNPATEPHPCLLFILFSRKYHFLILKTISKLRRHLKFSTASRQ